MAITLTKIEVWDPLRTTEVAYPVSFPPIVEQLSGDPEITYGVGRPARIRLSFESGSDIVRHTTGTEQSPYLKRNRILRLVYSDDSITEFRIDEFNRNLEGTSDAMVTGEHLPESLLAGRIVARDRDQPYFQISIVFHQMLLIDLIGELFSNRYNMPDLFVQGSVDSDLETAPVSLTVDGQNYLEVLSSVAIQAGGQLQITRDTINDKYVIQIVEAVGEQDSPADRLVSATDNRLSIRQEGSGVDVYSSAAVVSVSGDYKATMGEGYWEAIQVLYESATNVTTLCLEEITNTARPTCITYPRSMVPAHIVAGGNVIATNPEPASNYVYLIDGEQHLEIQLPGDQTAFLSTGDQIRFARNAQGNLIYQLTAPALKNAFGDIQRVFYRNEISPFANVLSRFGVTTDLSRWESGSPQGWQGYQGEAASAPVLSENTDTDFIRYGTKSSKVEADQGAGIRTIALDIDPANHISPYFSIWASLRVQSGSVRLQLRDTAGTIHPPADEQAESNVDNLMAIGVGGIQPDLSGTGDVYVEVIAQTDGTVFYLDAATLTNSTQSVELLAKMGPRELLREAARKLRQPVLDQQDDFIVEFYDRSYYDNPGSAQEIRIGDKARLKDSYDTDNSTFGIEQDLRVVELTEWDSRVEGRHYKRARLSNRPVELGSELDDRYTRQSDAGGATGSSGAVIAGQTNIVDPDLVRSSRAVTLNIGSSLQRTGDARQTLDQDVEWTINTIQPLKPTSVPTFKAQKITDGRFYSDNTFVFRKLATSDYQKIHGKSVVVESGRLFSDNFFAFRTKNDDGYQKIISRGLDIGETSVINSLRELRNIKRADIGNIRLDGNTISSTDANGDLILSPDGIGAIKPDKTLQAKDSAFTTDFSGTGYRATKQGDFNVRSLVVREAARFRELIIDQMAIIAGTDLRSRGRGKIESVNGSVVTLENPNNRQATKFVEGDFFWIKNVDIDGNLFTDLKGQITAININTSDPDDIKIELTVDTTVPGGTHEGGTGVLYNNDNITFQQDEVTYTTDLSSVSPGDVIAQRGHPTDTSRQSLIYTSVSDSDAPVQKYMTGIDSLAAFDNPSNVPIQFGNVSQLPGGFGFGGYFRDNLLISLDGDQMRFGKDAGGEGVSGIHLDDNNYWHTDKVFKVSGGILQADSNGVTAAGFRAQLGNHPGFYTHSSAGNNRAGFKRGQNAGDIFFFGGWDGPYDQPTDDARLWIKNSGEAYFASKVTIGATNGFIFDPVAETIKLGDNITAHTNTGLVDINRITATAGNIAAFNIEGGLSPRMYSDKFDGNRVGVRAPGYYTESRQRSFWAGGGGSFGEDWNWRVDIQGNHYIRGGAGINILDGGGMSGSNWTINKDTWIHPTLGSNVYTRAKIASTSTNAGASDLSLEYADSVSSPGTERNTKVRFIYEHRTGISKLKLEGYARRSTSAIDDPDPTHVSKVYLNVIGGNEESVNIGNSSQTAFSIEVDVSNLTNGHTYEVNIDGYVEAGSSNSTTVVTNLWIREDLVTFSAT